MMFRTAAVAVLSLSLSALPAFAADNDAERSVGAVSATESATAGAAMAGGIDWSMPPVHIGGAAKRPGTLAGLYVSLAGLQVYDAMSTARGMKQGAREANPLMQGAVNNQAMFWGLKAATTALPMIMAEKMWKKNKVGAVAMMAVANSVAAIVAANNARVIKGGR
jgi:Domain of unknown function (DUF5658)